MRMGLSVIGTFIAIASGSKRGEEICINDLKRNGKPFERVGRKAAGLSPSGKDRVAGLPGKGATSRFAPSCTVTVAREMSCWRSFFLKTEHIVF